MPPSDWPSVATSWVVLAGSSRASRMTARDGPSSRSSAVPDRGPVGPLPQGSHAARRIDQRRRPGRVDAERDPGPDEYGGHEQQAAAAQFGFLVLPPVGELDPALGPAQVRMQVGQRRGPALRDELAGPVDHVPFEDGPQRVPFGLEQRLPGDGQDISGVSGRLVAGQDAPDPGIDPGLPALAPRRPAAGPGWPESTGPGRAGRRSWWTGPPDGGQEVRAPARRVQREQHVNVGLAGQRLIAAPDPDQPGPQHGLGWLTLPAAQLAQRVGQLPQR